MDLLRGDKFWNIENEPHAIVWIKFWWTEVFLRAEKAKRSIMAGNVLVDGHPITKPGHPVKADQPIDLKKTEPFVSRGGLKLDHALQQFPLAVQGLVAADLGASTGGFTDCLLQHQCSKVYAIDVGSGQLAWKLRQDERVIVMERINARHLKATISQSPWIWWSLIVPSFPCAKSCPQQETSRAKQAMSWL